MASCSMMHFAIINQPGEMWILLGVSSGHLKPEQCFAGFFFGLKSCEWFFKSMQSVVVHSGLLVWYLLQVNIFGVIRYYQSSERVVKGCENGVLLKNALEWICSNIKLLLLLVFSHMYALFFTHNTFLLFNRIHKK